MNQETLTPNLQCAGIHDVGRCSFDKVHHVVECGAKVQLIAVFFYVANVRRTNAIFQSEKCMPLKDGFVLKYINGSEAGSSTIEGTD